jgi:hypothetical protein
LMCAVCVSTAMQEGKMPYCTLLRLRKGKWN